MRTKPAITLGTVLVAIGLTVVLTISALAMLPSLVRTDRVKARLVETVKAVTGRDLAIRGKVTVSLLPALSVLVTDVSLSNPPDFPRGDLVRAGALSADVKLLPLLSGRVEFQGFELVDPAVTLETDRQGRRNWILTPQASAPLPLIRLADMHVRNGRLAWVDHSTGVVETATAIDLAVHANGTLSAEGSLSWHGLPANVAFEVDQPWALTTAESDTPVRLALDAAPVHLTFSGHTSARKGTEGDLALTAPSLTQLAAWTAGPAKDPPGAPAGRLSLRGKAGFGSGSATLADATITLDGTTARGDLALAPGPALKGRLAVQGLDLEKFPFDAAAALRSGDADLALDLGPVSAGPLHTGPGTLALVVHDGVVAADLAGLELYGGTATGRVTLDARGPVPEFDARLALSNVQAEPLLAAALGRARLGGTAAIQVHLTGRMAEGDRMLSSLAGDGSGTVTGGSIRGLDLAALVHHPSAPLRAEDTAFDELSGSWSMAGGVVTARSLALRAPGLKIDGAATVDLPARRLTARLEPKGVADAVPVTMGGGWDDLTVAAAAPATPAVTPPRRKGGRHAGGGAGR